jgi:hypothetical protein
MWLMGRRRTSAKGALIVDAGRPNQQDCVAKRLRSSRFQSPRMTTAVGRTPRSRDLEAEAQMVRLPKRPERRLVWPAARRAPRQAVSFVARAQAVRA